MTQTVHTVKQRYKLMCELVHATRTMNDFRARGAKPVIQCETLEDLVTRGAEVMHGMSCGGLTFEEWYDNHNVQAHAKRFMEQEDAKDQ